MRGGAAERGPAPSRHVCIVYDCLFPCTIGGAERWYRALAERLVREGHRVTYLTLRQWDAGEVPRIEGVEVVAVGPRLALYADGKRRIWPPLRFGWGVLVHLLRRGRRYDHVQLASFPFFSLLAAGLVRPLAGFTLGVDWFEVWSKRYWQDYLGAIGGRVGWLVQRLCSAVPQRAFVFSRLHGDRLAPLGRETQLLAGLYIGPVHPPEPPGDPATFVYAGRMIPEKRVLLLVEAFALVHAQRPDLRLRLFGKGPDRATVAERIAALALEDAVSLSDFVEQQVLDAALSAALAIVQPSEREGYGMVVVEASARGVPAIVVEGEDNAAVELVEAGANGEVSAADAESLASAMLAVAADPAGYRAATRRWFAANHARLAAETSMARLLECCDLRR